MLPHKVVVFISAIYSYQKQNTPESTSKVLSGVLLCVVLVQLQFAGVQLVVGAFFLD